MSLSRAAPTRFIGLDIHKHYLVAVGVDAQQQVVFGFQRVAYPQLTTWIAQHLTVTDAVVLEMTTNAFHIHDDVLPVVQVGHGGPSAACRLGDAGARENGRVPSG